MALNQDDPQPSSPLTDLPTSDAESCSFPSPKHNNTDEDSESPEDMAEPNIHSSSPYLPNNETLQVTATSTPLKNKPFGSRQMSAAASRNLQRLASDPYKCILTRQVPQMGCTITKSHIIPQATPPPEVRKLITMSHPRSQNHWPVGRYGTTNGCLAMMQAHSP
jgi:hypothetical protein